MKLTAKNAEKAVSEAKPPYFLLYGPDQGQSSIYADSLRKKHQNPSNPFSYSRFTYKEICESPVALADSLVAQDFFGGTKIIQIDDVTPAFPQAIKDILQKTPPAEVILIFIAEELPTSSPLRKWFEESAHAASIPSYTEESFSLERNIEQQVRQEGKTITAEACRRAAQLLAKDRLLVRAEIEKLCLYAKNAVNIDEKQVQECLLDSEEVAMEKCCEAVFSCNPIQTHRYIQKLIEENIALPMFCRAVAKHAMRLLEIKLATERGVSLEQAVSSLRPPIFFKQIPSIKQQASKWSAHRVLNFIALVVEWEKILKTTAAPTETTSFYTSVVQVHQSAWSKRFV
jgi:DNA polymerase-3 subunit delta